MSPGDERSGLPRTTKGSGGNGVCISGAGLPAGSGEILTSDDQHIIPRQEPSANMQRGTDETPRTVPRNWNPRMIAATEQ